VAHLRALILWVLAAALAGAIPDARPALFGALLAIALYPVVVALFMQAERLVEPPVDR
jgi:hypothetical protein